MSPWELERVMATKKRTQEKRPRNKDTGGGGELQRIAREHTKIEDRWEVLGDSAPISAAPKSYKYEREIVRLQFELLKWQEWVRLRGMRVCVLFEGRDAAGKGGVIRRISECLNPRVCRIVALGVPTERERSQWYFQRYVAQLPAAGEIVLFDRSWYNRAGVEKVMGFCSDDEYQEFLRACPLFEEMLIRSGILLVKYWFSVDAPEQERRFLDRMHNPIKRWKLSTMDLASRNHWTDYSRAKDMMLKHTDRDISPWFVVDASNKKRARLNCIAHLLSQLPYKDLQPVELVMPPLQSEAGYKRPRKSSQRWIPDIY
jgi:polyphosphate kinase 2